MIVIVKPNGAGLCPLYDGPCDWNGKCSDNTSACKRYHKKASNRKRRQLDKEIIKEETNVNNLYEV